MGGVKWVKGFGVGLKWCNKGYGVVGKGLEWCKKVWSGAKKCGFQGIAVVYGFGGF